MNQITNWTEIAAMKHQLESFVDQTSLERVLELLSEVCWDKGDHIRHDWQDAELALRWERAGNTITVITAKASITNLS